MNATSAPRASKCLVTLDDENDQYSCATTTTKRRERILDVVERKRGDGEERGERERT